MVMQMHYHVNRSGGANDLLRLLQDDGLKYSLFYGRDGQRIVGYDNERGKSDHRHVYEVESLYKFVSVEQLVSDFLADVERVKNEHHE